MDWGRGLCSTQDAPNVLMCTLTYDVLLVGIAAEAGKHNANDQKCRELGWVGVPLAVETYDCWGEEAQCSVSRLAARLALQLQCSKSKAITNIYQRLNLIAMLEPCSPGQGFSMQRTWAEGSL